jgi:hypothetical protein
MEAPRKPRYAGVREQLDALEEDIRKYLTRSLFFSVNHAYWYEMDEQAVDTVEEVSNSVVEAFDTIVRVWESIEDVRLALETAREIFKHTVAACIDVARPEDGHDFMVRVLNNMIRLFAQQFRPRIECVMIPYEHCVEIIQRSWRRCSSNPEHLVCRRRLMYEFESLTSDLERCVSI